MSEHAANSDYDHCEQVLERMYEFLDNELDNATGDAIRHHLTACEPCLDRFDVEQALRALVRQRCGGDVAPTHLRQKIVTQLTVIRRSL
jgi:mycothiol system anti-sigma-R factor